MKSARLILIVALLAVTASALKGPTNRSYRALAMGGAFVAVVDDRDAVFLNPAGLAQIGRLGTPLWPDRSHLWGESIEMQWNFMGFDLPLDALSELYDYNQKWGDLFRDAQDIDALLQDPRSDSAIADLWALDRKPIPINLHGDASFAIHNFGLSAWGEVIPIAMIDRGAITPKVGISLVSMQVLEAGIARSFGPGDRMHLGVGYRVAAFSREVRDIDILDIENLQDSAEDIGRETIDNVLDATSYGHGFDVGLLWWQTPELKFGGSIRNVGMRLEDRWVTPNLDVGLAWVPVGLQASGTWKRRIQFGFQLAELLDDERGYKPLSKIRLGGEWTQTLLPRILTGRLSAGLYGGYPTFGFSGELLQILHLEAVTYAEETGFYTGHLPQRYWMLKFGAGF